MTTIGSKQRERWLNRPRLIVPAFGPLVLGDLPIPVEGILPVGISNRSLYKQFPHIVTIRDVIVQLSALIPISRFISGNPLIAASNWLGQFS